MRKIFILFTLLLAVATAQAQFIITRTDGSVTNVDGQLKFDAANDGSVTAGGVPVSEIASIKRSRGNVDLKYVAQANYFKGERAASADGSANYYIALSAVPVDTLEDGTINPSEPGLLFCFDLYEQPAADSLHITIPARRYVIEDRTENGVCNEMYSFGRELVNADSTAYITLDSGYVDVSVTPDTVYTINANVYATTGEHFTMSYTGKIHFTDRSTLDSQETLIKENIDNTVYKYLTITDNGGDDDYFRYTLQLADGNSTASGVLTDGTVLNIDLFSTRPPQDSLVINSGTYVAGKDYTEIEDFEAGTFQPGDVASLMGYPLYYGTYVQDLRHSSEEGFIRYGYCNEGTVTVKRSGNKYDISVDLTTRNGYKVTGTYSGVPIYIDNRPQVKPYDWDSSLSSDTVISYSNDTYCYAHRTLLEGKPLAEFLIVVNDHKTNTSSQFSLLVPDDVYSPVGTYTLASDTTRHSYMVVPGSYANGTAVMNGTWPYFEYESSASAAIVGQAPATEGTVTVSQNANGTYTVSYNLKDDAEPKHTITGTWTGNINDTWGEWKNKQ